MEQRSDEWFQARLGKVTASRVADVMARTRSGYGASRTNYMMELLCQRLTGVVEPGYSTAAMQRGTDLEPVARAAYEVETGEMVQECGLVLHPSVDGFGASPDGLVGAHGLLEIKCPNTAQHVAFLRTGMIEERYRLQMLAQMACTGRQWCDFVSYDDRLPEPLSYKRVRFLMEDERHLEMLNEIRAFLAELDDLEAEMLELQQKLSKAA